ncbi:MAG TPA: hypothetical protein VI233_11575 [Puia sp.]
MEKSNSSNPAVHTNNIKKEFSMLVSHLREDVNKVEDPAARALFETSAEVISGLEKAFTDYERKTEPAWNKEN